MQTNNQTQVTQELVSRLPSKHSLTRSFLQAFYFAAGNPAHEAYRVPLRLGSGNTEHSQRPTSPQPRPCSSTQARGRFTPAYHARTAGAKGAGARPGHAADPRALSTVSAGMGGSGSPPTGGSLFGFRPGPATIPVPPGSPPSVSAGTGSNRRPAETP